MATFKCKMCGGALEITENQTVCECVYCGSQQTLPKLSDDKKANMYDRANHFRRNNEFDKAMGIYEQILNEDNTDAEAYWSLVLCRYGIEYVEDPATHKRIPTVNRAQYTSIFDDDNYKSALANADSLQKSLYEDEAKAINEIQKGILEISQKEEPFDVFICYKETDNNGRRTQDSVLATDLYHQLTQEGFKVFFSRITLEDKLGSAYEPYIFAALNSAKVMVVMGTNKDYFNAVWVKNEWSRYLALVKQSAGNKMLIPAYRDMDPYDLPEEFSHLQAQDMSKLGFMQDLIRGIKKIVGAEQPQQIIKESVVMQQGTVSNNANINALIKRGYMALEDGEWQNADEFFEEVLNQDAECAEAYLGKLMSKCKSNNISSLTQYYISQYDFSETEKLEACPEDIDHINDAVARFTVLDYLSEKEIKKHYCFDRSYFSELSFRKQQKDEEIAELSDEKLLLRAQQYAAGETKTLIDKMLENITDALDRRIVAAKQVDDEQIASVSCSYKEHLKDADAKVEGLFNEAFERREADYNLRVGQMSQAKLISDYESVRDLFRTMHGYKDTEDLVNKCQAEINKLKMEERKEQEKREDARRKEYERLAKKKKKVTGIVSIAVVVCTFVLIIMVNIWMKEIKPSRKYAEAEKCISEQNYRDAISLLKELGDYEDSREKYLELIDYIAENELDKSIIIDYIANNDLGSNIHVICDKYNVTTQDLETVIEKYSYYNELVGEYECTGRGVSISKESWGDVKSNNFSDICLLSDGQLRMKVNNITECLDCFSIDENQLVFEKGIYLYNDGAYIFIGSANKPDILIELKRKL